MIQPLNRKQQIPLTEEERRLFIDIAHRAGTTPGLLGRALLMHGLDCMDTDPTIRERIESEKSATKQRISDGARYAAQQRWGINEGEKK